MWNYDDCSLLSAVNWPDVRRRHGWTGAEVTVLMVNWMVMVFDVNVICVNNCIFFHSICTVHTARLFKPKAQRHTRLQTPLPVNHGQVGLSVCQYARHCKLAHAQCACHHAMPALIANSGPPAEEELDQKSADIDIHKSLWHWFQTWMRFGIVSYFDLRWNNILRFQSDLKCISIL